ncbi:MAG: hypothetical protein HKN82_19945 [Akkermansiaceae bacterium]|nr:hypothetical protein [Akkermansiaceae bacterium]
MTKRILGLTGAALVLAAPAGMGDSFAPDAALEAAALKSGDLRIYGEGRRYNPKSWAAGHDFTGIARKVPAPLHRSAVALANTDPKRDWIATAAHTIGGRQPPLTFVDAKGRKYTIGPEGSGAKITRKNWMTIPGTDFAIAECGELPDGIRKYPIPARMTKEQHESLHDRCVIVTTCNGDRAGLVRASTVNMATADTIGSVKHPDYPEHYLKGIKGDSGSPWFMPDPRGNLVAVSTFTTPFSGTFFGGPKVLDWIESQALPITQVSLVP